VKRTTVRREDTWRVVELDGQLVRSWLPGIEADDRDGPIDRGGFAQYVDAWAFSLGVDHERAFHGHLAGITTMDIDKEREALDSRCSHSDLTPEPVTTLATLPVTKPVYTKADELRDDLEIELRMLTHRVA
jgi:hypothetical protein